MEIEYPNIKNIYINFNKVYTIIKNKFFNNHTYFFLYNYCVFNFSNFISFECVIILMILILVHVNNVNYV